MREFVNLVEKWVYKYMEKPEVIKSYLRGSVAAREIGRSVYQYFVNSNQIIMIEEADIRTKNRVWETAKKWACLEKGETVKLAKTIYLFENLLQKQVQ